MTSLMQNQNDGSGGGGGFMSGVGSFLQNNSQGLLGVSQGLLGNQGWNAGLSGAAQGFAQGNQRDQANVKKRKSDAATQALIGGMTNLTSAQQQALQSDPELAKAVAAQGLESQIKPHTSQVVAAADGNYYSYDEQNPSSPWKQVGNPGMAKTSTNTPTDNMKDYVFAKQNGFNGSFVDYKQSLKENANQADPRIKNAQPGYMWNDPTDPTKGMTAIPGSGAQESQTKATATQGQDQGFYERAAKADQIVSKSGGDIGASLGHSVATSLPLGNYLQGADAQQYEQAKADFIAANLRMESGAKIDQTEYADANKRFFPQPGDTQPVIDQKAAARQAVINGLHTSATGYRNGVLPGQGTQPANDGFVDAGNGYKIRLKGQ